MKKVFLALISLFTFYSTLSAQNNSEISIVYGKSTGGLLSSVLRGGFPMGGGSHKLGVNNKIGFRYSSNFKSKENLKYEIGISYLNAEIEFKSDADPDSGIIIKDFMLISAPFYLKHKFWNYFYFNYGVMLDYQVYNSNPNFGLGIGFGLGVKYDFNNCFFYINPNYEKHLFLSEEYGLIEFGILIGIGYSF